MVLLLQNLQQELILLIKAGTTILADTGTFNIPITLGEDTVQKYFHGVVKKKELLQNQLKL